VNPSDLKSRIRAEAAELGLPACRFARVQPLPHGRFFADWVAAGNHGEMSYLARGAAKRLDPGLVLPGVRTIISLACPYPAAPRPRCRDWRAELRGRIAAYAAGRDYHRLLGAKLQLLAARIASIAPNCSVRAYVDTGPVLEREWAWIGGLGWFGKNTMLLRRDWGSWFFLGVLLTDLELEPDPPVPAHCGRCVRCLANCPTRALSESYRLDARRCISYLTIEHRESIPRELRPLLGNWVFGCDECLDACPWNSRLPASPELSEELRPSLPELLAMDEAHFRARFRGTAVLRARRAGLARNACIALGNSGNPEAVPCLARALAEDPAALVRGHAAWALGRFDFPAARRALDKARRDPDASVRLEAERALLSIDCCGDDLRTL